MGEHELEKYLQGLNKYEDDVIYGIIKDIKEHKDVDMLRLRVNGIDTIKSHGLSIEDVQSQLKHWSSEFIKIERDEE